MEERVLISDVPLRPKKEGEKTVVFNMILKDESKIIERCLNSLKDHIDYYCIVDTGSTDDTPQKIQQVFKDIPGEIHIVPWPAGKDFDFKYNRNLALKKAYACKMDYILLC